MTDIVLFWFSLFFKKREEKRFLWHKKKKRKERGQEKREGSGQQINVAEKKAKTTNFFDGPKKSFWCTSCMIFSFFSQRDTIFSVPKNEQFAFSTKLCRDCFLHLSCLDEASCSPPELKLLIHSHGKNLRKKCCNKLIAIF